MLQRYGQNTRLKGQKVIVVSRHRHDETQKRGIKITMGCFHVLYKSNEH